MLLMISLYNKACNDNKSAALFQQPAPASHSAAERLRLPSTEGEKYFEEHGER